MSKGRRRVTVARVPWASGLVIALLAALIAAAFQLVAALAADALLAASSTVAHRLVESAGLAFGVVVGVQVAIFLRHVSVELLDADGER